MNYDLCERTQFPATPERRAVGGRGTRGIVKQTQFVAVAGRPGPALRSCRADCAKQTQFPSTLAGQGFGAGAVGQSCETKPIARSGTSRPCLDCGLPGQGLVVQTNPIGSSRSRKTKPIRPSRPVGGVPEGERAKQSQFAESGWRDGSEIHPVSQDAPDGARDGICWRRDTKEGK